MGDRHLKIYETRDIVPTPGVRTLLALDAQGHEIARFPSVP